MKHNRIIDVISILGLAALTFMLTCTSPTAIGPLGVLLFFTTLYLVLFGFSTFLFRTFCKFAFKNKQFHGKDYLYSAVFSFGPIMLLMARSFGAISITTIALIAIFLVLAEFLVYKRA